MRALTLNDGLVFGLLLIAVLLFFWPAEYVIGGADASVYLHLGAIWSRTGSFTFTEPLLADVSPALFPGLMREMRPGQPMQYLRFPGFYINAGEPSRIVPQFYPLHPTWLTLAYGLFGLSGSLYVTPLWAMLGVWAVYLAFKHLCGAKAGLIGAFLLMITPLQIYFARYPTAESLTQYLTWAALFSFIMYSTEGGALWGFLSGCALGQTFLTRIDALPMLLIPGVWLLLNVVRHGLRLELLWFFTPLYAFTTPGRGARAWSFISVCMGDIRQSVASRDAIPTLSMVDVGHFMWYVPGSLWHAALPNCWITACSRG